MGGESGSCVVNYQIWPGPLVRKKRQVMAVRSLCDWLFAPRDRTAALDVLYSVVLFFGCC
jgi:hypothetical protein